MQGTLGGLTRVSPKKIYRERGVMGAHQLWELGARFESDVFYQPKNSEMGTRRKREKPMVDKISMIKNRIALLEGRRGVNNKNIVAKLRRQLRKLEK